MRRIFLTFIFSIIATYSFLQASAQIAPLKRLWETGPGLKIPESVLYDPASGIIYVSSIDGKTTGKDSSGFISTLSVEGKLLKTEWLAGLDAPKGMGILNNHLFVTNIDEVVEIDIPTAVILKKHKVEGSVFLNDIAIEPETGMVFITDSGLGQVFVLQNGSVSLWLQGPLFKGANGLFLNKKSLFIGTGNSILRADIVSGEVTVAKPSCGSVDGLYLNSEGSFIFSDWTGSVFISKGSRRPQVLLNTTVQKENAADFGIIASMNLILIPTFSGNTVVCYSSPVIN